MQTIARANRVFREKVNGLIVDYVGVFRDLQKALAIYAGGGVGGQTPVQEKKELIELLKKAIVEMTEFCRGCGVKVERILQTEKLHRIKALKDAREVILVNDESRKKFLTLASRVRLLYQAILPDLSASQFSPTCALFSTLADMILSLAKPVDISGVLGEIEEVLDRSIAPSGYTIKEVPKKLDLSKIDFEAIRKHFNKGYKRAEIEKLKAAIMTKLQAMVAMNRMRVDFLEKFQKLIEEYNAGSANVEVIFNELLRFAEKLNEEERRHIKEHLTEEELAIFDILTKPRVDISPKEEREVKKVASDMIRTLKAQKLVLDWRKRQQSRAAVKLCIEEFLDKLPPVYSKEIYQTKCEAVYQHVYDNYADGGKSVYEQAYAYAN